MENEYILKMPKNVYQIIQENNMLDLTKSKLELKRYVCKSSSSKKEILKFILDDEPIMNSSKISYHCVFCKRDCKNYSVKSLIRRINKGLLNCTNCKEDNEDKQKLQSERMKKISGLCVKQTKIKKLTFSDNSNSDIIKLSNESFNKETSEFQEQYFESVQTEEEFQKLSEVIISFNNDEYDDIKKYIYYPHIIIHNDTKYAPRLYDDENDVLLKICYIKYKCMNCENEFTNRDFSVQKGRLKTMCKDCLFTNKIFKVRKDHNINGEILMYRSQFEKKLIDFCNENHILINSGPVVPYFWNEKNHKYYVDFQIDDTLIELKGNHVWHRNNMETGKWQEKEKAVREYVANSETYSEFVLIFEDKFDEFKQKLLDKI